MKQTHITSQHVLNIQSLSGTIIRQGDSRSANSLTSLHKQIEHHTMFIPSKLEIWHRCGGWADLVA